MKGPALAPEKIKEALRSDSANMFTESGLDLGRDGIWEDLGNLNLKGLKGKVAFDKIKKHPLIFSVPSRVQKKFIR